MRTRRGRSRRDCWCRRIRDDRRSIATRRWLSSASSIPLDVVRRNDEAAKAAVMRRQQNLLNERYRLTRSVAEARNPKRFDTLPARYT